MAIVQTAAESGGIADRNKSEVTLRVTEAASRWLLDLGAKAVETEVPAGEKWIADIAAFWVPTRTEAIKAKLILKKPKWVSPYGPEELRKQYNQEHTAWIKSYKGLPNYITIVHEVKTSPKDFKRDLKWERTPVADMQVLSYVKGILTPEQYPKNWWVLEHAEDGSLLKVKNRVPMHNVDVNQRLMLIANIADRRHNRTAYQFLRDLQKSHRLESGERKLDYRLSSCASAIMSVVKGEYPTVEECLRRHFNKKFPDYLVERLGKMYGIQKPGEQPNVLHS